jgi:hypothetical protein
MCRTSRKSGALTYRIPKGLFRPVGGLLYFTPGTTLTALRCTRRRVFNVAMLHLATIDRITFNFTWRVLQLYLYTHHKGVISCPCIVCSVCHREALRAYRQDQDVARKWMPRAQWADECMTRWYEIMTTTCHYQPAVSVLTRLWHCVFFSLLRFLDHTQLKHTHPVGFL